MLAVPRPMSRLRGPARGFRAPLATMAAVSVIGLLCSSAGSVHADVAATPFVSTLPEKPSMPPIAEADAAGPAMPPPEPTKPRLTTDPEPAPNPSPDDRAPPAPVNEPAPPGMYVVEPPPPPLRPRYWHEHVQVGANVGYVFRAGVDVDITNVSIGDGAMYGVYADFTLIRGLFAVVNYMWLPTELVVDSFRGPDYRLMGLDAHYLHVGLQQEFLPGPVRPFLEFLLGASIFHPRARGFDDDTRFSTILGGGVKFLPTPRFGFRAQARFITSFSNGGSGGAFFCGVGGCSAGVVGSGILQFELSGGAFVTF